MSENHGGSRRSFLRNAALAGGASLLAGTALAQPQPDPNESCLPPTYNPNAPQPMPTPTPFVKQPRPVVQRKSIWDLSPSEQTRLEAAYAALRALPASDPRGWLPQAHVHCYYCSGSTDHPSQIEIHGGWNFMPWHRAYLYYHERILAALVGDDTFFLPYWDWDNPARTTFPALYMNGSLNDPVRGANPTSSPTLASVFSHYGIDINTIMQDPDYTTFMGTQPDTFNNYGGNVENGPHGLVHLWVGQPTLQDMNGVADMGVLQTAARDPVFFTHHCNIDKLWAIWNASDPGHTDPDSCLWAQTTWTFYDENQTWRSITAADVADEEGSLFYTYGSSATPQAKKSSVFVTTAQAVHDLDVAPKSHELQTPLQAPKTLPAATATRLLLHIDGIDVPPDKGALVRVFVNLPSANAQTPGTDPHMVGFFAIVPKTTGPGGHVHKKTNIVLDVTKKLPLLEPQSDGKLTVTLVPSAGPGQTPSTLDLTYERVWVESK